MYSILNKVSGDELKNLIARISPEWNDQLIPRYFSKMKEKYNKYDPDLLWLLLYETTNSKRTLNYLDANYKKFKDELHILDPNFAEKVIKNGRFQSHVWEMILCDVLSASGTLIKKGEAGADLLLSTASGQLIQIEAVVPKEATDPRLQSIKPVFDEKNQFSHSGVINDLEKPIVLRFLQGFDDKAKDNYDKNKPLIIAINTGLVVGLSTYDEFVLRQALFGLGCSTILLDAAGNRRDGLQQTPVLDKGGGPFIIGRFRDPSFTHISGIIYSSEKPHTLIPDGQGWHNSGLIYVANPLATHPADVSFDCMKTIVVNESIYYEEEAKTNFISSLEIVSGDNN